MNPIAIIFLIVVAACIGFVWGYLVARRDFGSPGEDE